MSFCFKCAQKMERKIPEYDNLYRLVCPKCDYVHYDNPKLIVGTLPYFEKKILLCKRNIEPMKSYWTLPGGFLELSESIAEGAIRESKEEAGINCTDLFLFSVYSTSNGSYVYILFTTELRSIDTNPGPETKEACFFSMHYIPWDEIAFPAITFTLQKFIKTFPNHRTVSFVH